jgi:4a-hydroxytetrahydrobiopterin dehydratase
MTEDDTPMNAPTQEELTRKKCAPCEGGIPPLSREQAEATVRNVEGWTLAPDGKSISRSWTVKDFMAGIDFFNKVAAVAEEEDHHPDLHLEGYRKVTINLSTHAVNGLTENDFILAAKINRVPVQPRR